MNAVNAYVENIMLGPTRDLLERRLIGQFKISGFEIQSYYARGQDAFVGLLRARIIDTIGRMADVAIGRDDVRDYSHMRGEFPRIARSDPREINGLRNIIGNTQGVLHDIHAPVLDFKRWDSDAEHQRAQREYTNGSHIEFMSVKKPRWWKWRKRRALRQLRGWCF